MLWLDSNRSFAVLRYPRSRTRGVRTPKKNLFEGHGSHFWKQWFESIILVLVDERSSFSAIDALIFPCLIQAVLVDVNWWRVDNVLWQSVPFVNYSWLGFFKESDLNENQIVIYWQKVLYYLQFAIVTFTHWILVFLLILCDGLIFLNVLQLF